MPSVLPPGTFGWVGSGFDCGCDCTFEAGFHYNGNAASYWGTLAKPICNLMFAIGNVRNGCTSVDIRTTSLTVVLKRNGTVISEPLLYLSGFNAYYWERWKPTAGDVYTAEISLNCGSGVVTRTITFTIPTPANTNCTCCSDRVPDFATVSGLTGSCCTFGNGTFGLSLLSGCRYYGEANFSDPGNCSSYCYSCNAFRAPGIPDDVFYFSPKKASVWVGIGVDPITLGSTPNPDTIVTYLRMEYWIYRVRTDFGVPTCAAYSTGIPTPCATGNEWRMTSLCNGLAMTFTDVPGLGALCIGQTPAIGVFFK